MLNAVPRACLCLLAALLLAGCGDRPAGPTTGVVGIAVTAKEHPSSGTGWVYSAAHGLVVTAYHVINGAPVAQVKVGKRPWQLARIVAEAPCEDVALLAVDDTRGLATVPLASKYDLEAGQVVTATGLPSGAIAGRMTGRGSILRVRVSLGPRIPGRDTPPLDDLLQTADISIDGFSGGPVQNAAGRLVGQVFGTWTPHVGTPSTLSIRVDRLAAVLAGFKRGRAPGSVGYGLYFTRRGAIVTGGGLAGGFAHGGVLVTAANGRPVGATFASWCRTVGSLPPGPVMLTLVRRPGGPRSRLSVTANRARLSGP
jgi:S1-C subfamily serine protease